MASIATPVVPVAPPLVQNHTFCHIYGPGRFRERDLAPMARSAVFSGPLASIGRPIDPNEVDVDAVCCTMLTQDLLELLRAITRPTNQLVGIRDFDKFDDWLHMIADPIVVRVYAGDTFVDRMAFRARVLGTLRVDHGIVLIAATNSVALSRNKLSISTLDLARAL